MSPISRPAHIYPNMCAIFGYGPTVVSREKGGTDTLRHQADSYQGTLITYGCQAKFIVPFWIAYVVFG